MQLQSANHILRVVPVVIVSLSGVMAVTDITEEIETAGLVLY